MSSKKPTKDKIKEKAKAMKSKLKSKVKKVEICLALLLLVAGCSTSEPASRATCARYGDIVVKVGENAKDNDIKITIGDGAIASADSTGSTETMTANPTNDVKSDIDVSVPVNKAGAAQSVGSVLGDAVAGLVKGAVSGGKSSGGASADCPDGNCGEGACADGSCNE